MELLFIGGQELLFVLLAVLLLFGANKIPEIARMIGKGMNEFKKAANDIKQEINDSSGNLIDESKKIKDDLDDVLKK